MISASTKIQDYLDLIQEHTHTQFALDNFKTCFKEYTSEKTKINLTAFTPYVEKESYQTLKETSANLEEKVAIIKLNGGLGTSLNCNQTKSLIPLIGKNSLFDYFIQQLETFPKDKKPQLILMNSFYTNTETLDYLKTKSLDIPVSCIEQSRYPRLLKTTLAPYKNKTTPTQNWNPPGHGELFSVLYESGTLEKLLREGREYLFISNSDNLGATYENKILNHIIQNKLDFLMESTPKTQSDIKGGIIVKEHNNIKLIEIAQVDESQHPLFFNLDQFKSFNTNNLWVKISSLISCIENKKLILDPIYNNKKIDGDQIIQFETAMGSAIQSFENTDVLSVPRSRFFPIKTINDVFRLLSDCFELKNGKINRLNKKDPKKIDITGAFHSIQDLQKKCPVIPSLKNCDSVTLNGPLTCFQSTSLLGHVKISCKTPYDLGQYKTYENCSLNVN